MTSTITRRGAIATMASGAVAATLAATTVGVAVAKSAPDDDSYLLNLTAKFHKHYAQAHTAHVTWVSEKDRVDALPDVRRWLERAEFLIKRKLAADLAEFEAGDVAAQLDHMMVDA